jgi:hypothetical protein
MLRIKDWNDHYENNRTRILKKLDWVPIPNSMDGLGYIGLMDHPNAAAHFGAWIAMVEIASRCEPRGCLLRNGKELDAKTLSVLSRISADVFREAIPRLVDIEWLESTDGAGIRHPSAAPSDNEVPDERHMEPHTVQHPSAAITSTKEGKEGKEGKETYTPLSGADAPGDPSLPDEVESLDEEPVSDETVRPSDGPAYLESIGWDGGWKFVKKAKPDQIAAIQNLKERDLTPDESLDSLYMIHFRLWWFEEFWQIYWRHVDKKAARIAYLESVMSLDLHDQIIAAVNEQTPAMLSRSEDKRPHAATWIHHERWTDAAGTPNAEEPTLWAARS